MGSYSQSDASAQQFVFNQHKVTVAFVSKRPRLQMVLIFSQVNEYEFFQFFVIFLIFIAKISFFMRRTK